ncbi:hypothetical protein ACJJTC_011774 [Scirpophaga incertulas]
MQQLEYHFARSEVIICHEVATLKKLPNLTSELKGLPLFTSAVQNTVASIRVLNQIEYLYSPELFYCIVGKLNHTLRMRWTDFASENYQNKPKLELLSEFLVRELERHVKFGMSPDTQVFSLHKVSSFRPSNRFEVSTYAVSGTKPQNNCIYCKKISGVGFVVIKRGVSKLPHILGIHVLGNARTIDSLFLHRQTITASDISKYSHLADISDMLTYTNAVPTVLIGAEDWYLSITHEARKGCCTHPVGCLTVLGLTVYGPVDKRAKPVAFISHLSFAD